MSIFKNLSAEEVAVQHQFMIELLFVAVCAQGPEIKQSIARSVQQTIDLCRETGSDTTILEATLAHILQLPAQEASR